MRAKVAPKRETIAQAASQVAAESVTLPKYCGEVENSLDDCKLGNKAFRR